MENFGLNKEIERVDDQEAIRQEIAELQEKIQKLKGKLSSLEDGSEGLAPIVAGKRDRLDRIRHGVVELSERMQRPYVVSAELQAVKEVLDVLSENGECNSVILEGEPGTGKTQWAYSEAGQEMQEGKDVSLVHVRVKDTMRAQDLLYSVDDVRRLSDAQAQAQIPDEIRQEAAGWKRKIIAGDIDPATDEGYKAFKGKMEAVVELGEAAKDLDYIQYVDLGPLGEAIHQSGQGKKVYLVIDEIEKGREELMTGILDEIENLTFTINETGTVIKGDKKNLRIVITTNTEDSDKIPSSFRRRSLYHYIEYPSRSDMAQIVELHFPGIKKELLDYAISAFYQYHENPDIGKKPSTPELLAWIKVLMKSFDGEIPATVPHKEILLKYQEDHEVDVGRINVESYEEREREEKEQSEGELPRYVKKALQGKPIYHLEDGINNYYDQGNYEKFFATLKNNGVEFQTPKFEEEEEDDGYRTYWENTEEFYVGLPGVENLGDGYYMIPDDHLGLFKDVIDTKTEVLPSGTDFTSVEKSRDGITIGTVEVNGESCKAYEAEDGRIVIEKAYTRE